MLRRALRRPALALFNFPLLIVWDQPVTVFGLPLLPVALFAIWAGADRGAGARQRARRRGREDDER